MKGYPARVHNVVPSQGDDPNIVGMGILHYHENDGSKAETCTVNFLTDKTVSVTPSTLTNDSTPSPKTETDPDAIDDE